VNAADSHIPGEELFLERACNQPHSEIMQSWNRCVQGTVYVIK